VPAWYRRHTFPHSGKLYAACAWHWDPHDMHVVLGDMHVFVCVVHVMT
jgi:hypothetical protein